MEEEAEASLPVVVHTYNRQGTLRSTHHVGNTAVHDLLVTPEGLKVAYCGNRLTLFADGKVSATVELPDWFVDLAACGDDVLAWKLNVVWAVEGSGRVQLAAETCRPVRSVWGHGAGFYVLAGELPSFQGRETAVRL